MNIYSFECFMRLLIVDANKRHLFLPLKAGNAAQGAVQKMGFVRGRGSAGRLLKLPRIPVQTVAHILWAFST